MFFNSMAEHYPHFEERVRIALKAMLGPEIEARINIGMAKDGSGVGGQSPSSLAKTTLILTVLTLTAALCALQAQKDQESSLPIPSESAPPPSSELSTGQPHTQAPLISSDAAPGVTESTKL